MMNKDATGRLKTILQQRLRKVTYQTDLLSLA